MDTPEFKARCETVPVRFTSASWFVSRALIVNMSSEQTFRGVGLLVRSRDGIFCREVR